MIEDEDEYEGEAVVSLFLEMVAMKRLVCSMMPLGKVGVTLRPQTPQFLFFVKFITVKR